MVMNTAPQGRGGYTGDSAGASGLVSPPNILEDKDAAIARLLQMVGLSPSSLSPAAQAIRKKAGALANELVLRAGQAGGNIDVLADPAQSLGMLAGIAREGLAGGKIFGGGGGKLGALENIAAIGSAAEKGGEGVTPGMAIVQQLLANPQNASELFRQAKYGGLSEKAQAGMALALETTMNAYRQGLEGSGIGGAGGNLSGLLSTLLGKPVGSGFGPGTDVSGNPIGGPGTAAGGTAAGANLPGGAPPPSMLGLPAEAIGTPSTAQAALPSALADPAAAQLMNPPGAMAGYGSNFAGNLFPPALLAALGQGGAGPGYQTGNMPPGTAYGPTIPPVDMSQYPPGTPFWQNR